MKVIWRKKKRWGVGELLILKDVLVFVNFR